MRPKWTSAGGILVNQRGKVALVQERTRARGRRWTLPKGKIDPGETSAEAALREVREETGIPARIVAYLGSHDGRRHFTDYYLMRPEGRPRAREREILAVRFFDLDRAAKLLRSARDLAALRRTVEFILGVTARSS
jgi:8-oxo-dGTP pyrophosphatase MutT (NUDIX family)